MQNIHLRIGHGTDIHALVAKRKLIVGGVEIAHPFGLFGHSDADVLAHAFIDALFGAAALGDIGTHFPDTLEEYRGKNSIDLLKIAYQKVQLAGFLLVNMDATIHAEAPKMSPHIPRMIHTFSDALALPKNAFNIKAKTGEQLGFVGRKEGIACDVVVLLAVK